MFLLFSLLMLALYITARFRSPEVAPLRALWFIVGLLPSELPWALGFVQLIGSVFLIAFATFSAPDVVAAVISSITLYLWYDLHRKTYSAKTRFQSALEEGLGSEYATGLREDLCITAPSEIEKRNWLKPFSYKRPGVERLKNIAYGNHPRQRLDIYRPSSDSQNLLPNVLRPVLLHVHGGGWIVGQKHQQALPLINYLVENGWLCVDINYRLGPKHRYPDCVVDVKTAIAWVKKHIAGYGGDAGFIALTGESAGGHLTCLSALTAGAPEFQPGFEDCDTSVQAVVPMYGVYDLTDSNHTWSGSQIVKLLRRYVMPVAQTVDAALWRAGSPKFRINKDSPPMLIVHGSTDCLVFIEDVRDFVTRLRATADAPVVYVELPGAQHGYDLFHSVRTEFSVEAVGKFLRYCYNKSLDSRSLKRG